MESMTYHEALVYSLTVPWKVGVCNSGEECWCRRIEPVDPVLDEDGNEIYIAGQGEIHRTHAEHIVKIHNASLK